MAKIILVYMSLNYETFEVKEHIFVQAHLPDVSGKTPICSLAGWTHVLVMWNQSWALYLRDVRYPSLHRFITRTFYQYMYNIHVDVI